MKLLTLTTTEITQLLSYAAHAEQAGWYYGNKAHFQKRHRKILKYLNALHREQVTAEYKQTGDNFI